MFDPFGLMPYNSPRDFSIRQRGLLGCLGCFLVIAVFGIISAPRMLLPCYLNQIPNTVGSNPKF